MQLYQGIAEQFIEQATSNEIAPSLEENFARYLGYRPAQSEIRSWTRSLKELAYRLDRARIAEAGVVVEYRLPQTSKRLDAMLIGPNTAGDQEAVIVELKQWERAYSSGIDETVVFRRGDQRDLHLHPSAQAEGYANHLRGTHTAFYSDTDDQFLSLNCCSYLHDAHSRTCGDLLAEEFQSILDSAPLFTGDMNPSLEAFLKGHVGNGDGAEGLQRVVESKFAPSRKLLNHVTEMIQGNPVFTLLDDQRIAYNVVLTKIRELQRTASKAVVLVVGGPGTGKSVIAVQLMAALAEKNHSVVHATGSKAFTTNLRAQVGREASALFKYFNSFVEAEPDEIDVLIADEAHRIRLSSNTRFQKRSTKSQIEEILDASKLSVFLLDDNQVVRPAEIGTPRLIEKAAEEYGADFWQVVLRDQFRCSGSDSYMRWVDWLFGLGGDPDLTWLGEYEFSVVGNPSELEQQIRAKAVEGESARMVAGFCWPWSNPMPDGSLHDDVVIGEWKRPWNRKERGSEPPHRHPYTIWATQETGLDEVGCIYSAQGFEFDYCGVIIGPDLLRRGDEWMTDKAASCDTVVKRSKDMLREVLNTYRVLLSRGMKGTLVYVSDEETRDYLERALQPTT